MCLACEQDALWFAYLQRRGLILTGGVPVKQPPSVFAADPVEPSPIPDGKKQKSTLEPADVKKFAGDDPAAG